jgi:uncharacterized protein YciI
VDEPHHLHSDLLCTAVTSDDADPAYFVYSRDAVGVAERMEALTPEHWSYMDPFADRLVARGPTLSADGEVHTGSVHVVSLADLPAARRFADEEPYQRAGLFAETTIVRWVNLVGRTMWDRPRPADHRQSTLVLARWEATPVGDQPLQVEEPDGWVFLGLLVTDDAAASIGLVGAVDADAAVAERAFHTLAPPERATVELHRWERGGRR